MLNISQCYQELGFAEAPFNLTPDTEFFFAGSKHQAALRHLHFGIANSGFTLLTGEVGLGKTLLCRHILRNGPPGIQTAYIFNPQQSYSDLLASIYFDLTGKTTKKKSPGQIHSIIYKALIEMAKNNQRAIVIVDEAHRLTNELLEGLRLLSNLDTEKDKLIHLVLIGQPELEKNLATKELRPLAQRISVRYKLTPFNCGETIAYIRHRLQTARKPSKEEPFRFTGFALYLTHFLSRGVPRRINQICDRALLAAFANNQNQVNARVLLKASREFKKFGKV
jgi:general secretion pathway protein A